MIEPLLFQKQTQISHLSFQFLNQLVAANQITDQLMHIAWWNIGRGINWVSILNKKSKSICYSAGLTHRIAMHTCLEVILVPGYILHMWNDQMSGSKAGNTWKGFQNNKYKIDTRGTDLFAYYDTQLWHNRSCDQERSIEASKLAWSGGTFFIRLHLKKFYASIPDISHS